MSKIMIINAIHQEECRIAIVADGKLEELEVESNRTQNIKGNIYKAKIVRLEPSLQAAFIDLGTKRNGFLQINDIHPTYYKQSHSSRLRDSADITELLEPGQELLVQVLKEERDIKGATLTTYLSLPGRYVVIMPGTDRGGISRKISDDSQRNRLKRIASELPIPKGMGVIIRTAGLDRSVSELTRDLNIQLKLWEELLVASQDAPCPSLLYRDGDLATRVMRDYFTPDILDVYIDDKQTYERVKSFVTRVMPRYRTRIKLYDKAEPIFSHWNIEKQVEETFNRVVKLKSGGELVIDQMEALVAIDVNSGKATQGQSIEETAFATNLEAAAEVARQIRLRDLGGLIVVDFIDMLDRRHRTAVEKAMMEAIKSDKAKVEITRLSKFGLMEMSRQRLRSSLEKESFVKCNTCRGTGRFKASTVVGLEVLRKLQSAVLVGGVKDAKVRLHPSPSLFLLNHKRMEIAELEKSYGAKIHIIPDSRLMPDEYQFEMEAKGDLKEVPDVTISSLKAKSELSIPKYSVKRSEELKKGKKKRRKGGERYMGSEEDPSIVEVNDEMDDKNVEEMEADSMDDNTALAQSAVEGKDVTN